VAGFGISNAGHQGSATRELAVNSATHCQSFQTHLISQCDTVPLLSFMLHLRLGLDVILLVVVLPLSCNTILHIGCTGHFDTVQLPGSFLTFPGPKQE